MWRGKTIVNLKTYCKKEQIWKGVVPRRIEPDVKESLPFWVSIKKVWVRSGCFCLLVWFWPCQSVNTWGDCVLKKQECFHISILRLTQSWITLIQTVCKVIFDIDLPGLWLTFLCVTNEDLKNKREQERIPSSLRLYFFPKEIDSQRGLFIL